MGGYARDDDRRIIPRWSWLHARRASEDVVYVGSAKGDEPRAVAILEEAQSAWLADPNDVAAGEFCSAALLAGQSSLAIDAAEFVIGRHGPESGLHRVASTVLGLPTARSEQTSGGVQDKIRTLRNALTRGSRDPIRWADLARCYAIIGKTKAAGRAMVVAEQLGRGGRVIARVASRCFVHTREPDRANHALVRSRRVKNDPWVVAAAIAVSNIGGQSSDYTRDARKLLSSRRFAPIEFSELRIALACQEFWFGQRRLGRKLVRDALEAPTENCLAQVAWLVRNGFLSPEEFDHGLGESAEAKSWSSLRAQKFEDCLAACDEWWRIEQFSSRPSELGSFVAATALGDADACVEQASRGLRANPGSMLLWNNLAVGLAEQGKTAGAAEALRRAVEGSEGQRFELMLSATRGLVAFRSGDLAGGRLLYREAIEGAERLKDSRTALLARLYLLREELRLGCQPEQLLHAIQNAKGVDDYAVSAMLDRVVKGTGR